MNESKESNSLNNSKSAKEELYSELKKRLRCYK